MRMTIADILSPLAGEMAAKQSEGVAAAVLDADKSLAAAPTPPGRCAATLPSRGRGTSARGDH
jgi:hypothetical protein